MTLPGELERPLAQLLGRQRVEGGQGRVGVSGLGRHGPQGTGTARHGRRGQVLSGAPHRSSLASTHVGSVDRAGNWLAQLPCWRLSQRGAGPSEPPPRDGRPAVSTSRVTRTPTPSMIAITMTSPARHACAITYRSASANRAVAKQRAEDAAAAAEGAGAGEQRDPDADAGRDEAVVRRRAAGLHRRADAREPGHQRGRHDREAGDDGGGSAAAVSRVSDRPVAADRATNPPDTRRERRRSRREARSRRTSSSPDRRRRSGSSANSRRAGTRSRPGCRTAHRGWPPNRARGTPLTTSAMARPQMSAITSAVPAAG